jgi:hypothetical protein
VTWDEFDLDGPSPVWCSRASRTKTQMRLKTPLVPAVVEWLKSLRTIAGSSHFVLPHWRRDLRRRCPHLGTDTLNATLNELPHVLEHFTLLNQRRSMRAPVAAMGVHSEVAERCLGDRLRAVESIYYTHIHVDGRRAGLEAWTNLLLDTGVHFFDSVAIVLLIIRKVRLQFSSRFAGILKYASGILKVQ